MFDKYISKAVLGAAIALLPLMQLAPANAQRIAKPDMLTFDQKKELYDYTFSYSLSENGDSVDVAFVYSMANKYLVFDLIKDGETKNYKSYFVTNLTFKDSDGIIRKRVAYSDSIVTTQIEQTTDAKAIHNGFVSARIPARNYSISMELASQNGNRLNRFVYDLKLDSAMKTKNVFALPNYVTNQNELSIEKSMPFSAKPLSIMIPVFSKNNLSDLRYKITAVKIEDKETSIWDWLPANSQSEGNINIHPSSVLEFKYANSLVAVNIKPTQSANQSVLQIDFGKRSLEPGKYKLEILSGTNVVYSTEIDVEWPNMPTALRTPNKAVDAMFYVLTDDQISSISSGKDSEVAKKVLDYWKKLDPTPDNTYNEAMAQYFRRYDEAHANYSNDANKQGEKTDRGMIYVLYGAPDDIKIELKDDKSFEIWKYIKKKKEITFEKVKMDTYKLSSVKE